ncbi:MAG: hypothetical protein HFI90_12050 [Clostridia bacterium]|nr:hypothetical protein [Clostridia bacterium]
MVPYKIRLSGGSSLCLSVSKRKTTYSVIGRFRQKTVPDTAAPNLFGNAAK